MNFINIFDVNNDQSYPPKVLKNEHFSGLIIIKEARVWSLYT